VKRNTIGHSINWVGPGTCGEVSETWIAGAFLRAAGLSLVSVASWPPVPQRDFLRADCPRQRPFGFWIVDANNEPGCHGIHPVEIYRDAGADLRRARGAVGTGE
jgi:hypothetical protein